jgi:GxxExxY protein
MREGMTENEIAKECVDAAFHVHTALGPGLLEHVYEIVLVHELRQRGLQAERQVPIPIKVGSVQFDEGFRADVLVDDKVILEIKSVAKSPPVFKKILLTYLRLADKRLGLLMNFGEELIKDGISRVANGLLDE